MTIKETILPLADSYAGRASVAFNDANILLADKARAALCAALDAADRELEAARNAAFSEGVRAGKIEAENAALRKELTELRELHTVRMNALQPYSKWYEELRQATDGGSESMTHEDAIAHVEYLSDAYAERSKQEQMTFEEIMHIAGQFGEMDTMKEQCAFARAVLAAHGIGEQG
jgi:hypothetical protein